MIIKSKSLVKILSFNFATAMAIFPFVLINDETLRTNKRLINHEKIHIRQQLELLVIPFYLWYFMEYGIRRIQHKNHLEAYKNISFEKEAFENECNLDYLENRKWYQFLQYL